MNEDRLPRHHSENYNGPLRSWRTIPVLRPRNVRISTATVGGDAPKRMCRIYRYERGGLIRRDRVTTWPLYIAKTAEKYHPIEGVTEYLINSIGVALGLPMNEFALYRYDGTIWFCSRYFLRPSRSETLLHGTEICGDYLQDHEMAKAIADDARDARQLFTFEFVREAIRAVFPDEAEALVESLFRVLVFDCLLGNNDRHFYNWGVILNPYTGEVGGLAPVYDSSRGLFWNVPDATIRRKASGRGGLDAYVEKYARNTRPRITCEASTAVNHSELLRYLTRDSYRLRHIAAAMMTDEKQALALSVIEEVGSRLLSDFRVSVITKLVTLRFAESRRALG